jgi:hypothetical protein
LYFRAELLQDRGNSIKFTTLVRELEPASSMTANKVGALISSRCNAVLAFTYFYMYTSEMPHHHTT